MPELPEVETIVNGLRASLIGREIADVTICWEGCKLSPLASCLPVSTQRTQAQGRETTCNRRRTRDLSVRGGDSLQGVSAEGRDHSSGDWLRQRIKGQRILDIKRRGKYIIFALSGGDNLIFHLKMTGQLLVRSNTAEIGRYVRMVFHLDDSRQLRFADMRKLGRVYLVDDAEAIVGTLGPEPLADDFKLEDFAQILRGRSGRIKPLLLNQRFIAGVGNIYANEILFAAGIHPLRKADTLAPAEVEALYHAIRQVLRQAIAERGTTFDGAYRDARGRRGRHQESLKIFRREGKPCPRCGTPIARIVLGGRGTYFCPRCQK